MSFGAAPGLGFLGGRFLLLFVLRIRDNLGSNDLLRSDADFMAVFSRLRGDVIAFALDDRLGLFQPAGDHDLPHVSDVKQYRHCVTPLPLGAESTPGPLREYVQLVARL